MKSKFLLMISTVTIAISLTAQNPVLIEQGRIIYERRINAYALLQKERQQNDPFIQQYKDRFSQFSTNEFELIFDNEKSLYRPIEERKTNYFDFLANAGASNIVFTDLVKDSIFSEKKIYENSYFIKEKITQIQWKWTDETRDIAGFQCRRANALILDSVYVVAFYTNQITTEGGPESFTGLPGMILGLAIPQLHTTWFAKSVIVDNKNQWIQKNNRNYISQREAILSLQPKLNKQSTAFPREWISIFL